MENDTPGCRHPVFRKFHDKRYRFAFEQHFLHDKAAQNSNDDPQQIEADHDQRFIFRKKRRGKHGIDWKLGAA